MTFISTYQGEVLMKLLSVVVPCYNEQENVGDFYTELMKNEEFFRAKGVEIELLFVDDGSKDETVNRVKELKKEEVMKRGVEKIKKLQNQGQGEINLQHIKQNRHM